MKPEMRQKLASEPFAEKVRKVAQLVRLTKTFPRSANRLVKRKGRQMRTSKLTEGLNSANAVNALHDEI